MRVSLDRTYRMHIVGLLVALTAALLAERASAQSPESPRRVTFFVWMIDIDSIDSQGQTFSVNMGMRLTWHDETLAHDGPASITAALDEIWNPRVSLGGIQAKTKMAMDEEAEIKPDGTVIYRQRFIGPLSQPLNLSDFPLDSQNFTVHFWATGMSPSEVDFQPEQLGTGNTIIEGGTISSELSLTDWTIDSFNAESRPLVASGDIQFAGFAFDIQATRLANYYIWQVIAPLALIVIMSWVPFWINPSNAATQFSIASTTVLTLIAYRFVAAGFVPRLPYMTRLDLLILGCTALVFAVFIQVLVTSRLAETNHVRPAVMIDKACRFLFPIGFALIMLRFWLG